MSHRVTTPNDAGSDSAISVRHTRGSAPERAPTTSIAQALKLRILQVSFQKTHVYNLLIWQAQACVKTCHPE
jgi:hypothetical protein